MAEDKENSKAIEERYERRRLRYQRLHQELSRRTAVIGNLRLTVFILGLALTIALYRTPYLSTGAFVIAAALFILLLIQHNRVRASRNYAQALQTVNENSLKRLKGEWTSFADTGEDFKDDNHPYAGDLDVFGQSSLFQWINTAHTYLGREKLSQAISQLPADAAQVEARQEAVAELAGDLSWCQRFKAEGMVNAPKPVDPGAFFRWAEARNDFYRRPATLFLVRLIPAITVLSVILYYATSLVPAYLPILLVVAQALALFFFGKPRSQVLSSVSHYEGNLRVYHKLLERLEKRRFQSPLLQDYQKKLRSRDNRPAFVQMQKLSKLVDAISNRENAFFLIINILLLWDFQCMIALEQWKRESGRLLAPWLHTIGELEALVSLAGIAQNQPHWVIPKVEEGEPKLSAQGMGHPLLGQGRVLNDLNIHRPAGILLITGSNMSGKSTLLRTAGINLVLAYAGAPVCAAGFDCSIMRIYTCMRVSDNLEKSISSFYAELLRIKLIVEATQAKGWPLFFLLDEIFKGTNSQDRHMGARILIRQLSQRAAMGMVSTHDLELGDLEQESKGKIKNYHFREYYENNQIHFDYKLRRGISTTRNAMYLIRMIGIAAEDEGAW